MNKQNKYTNKETNSLIQTIEWWLLKGKVVRGGQRPKEEKKQQKTNRTKRKLGRNRVAYIEQIGRGGEENLNNNKNKTKQKHTAINIPWELKEDTASVKHKCYFLKAPFREHLEVKNVIREI